MSFSTLWLVGVPPSQLRVPGALFLPASAVTGVVWGRVLRMVSKISSNRLQIGEGYRRGLQPAHTHPHTQAPVRVGMRWIVPSNAGVGSVTLRATYRAAVRQRVGE